MDRCQISVVVPAHNEVETIAPLVKALDALLQRAGRNSQIIVVDDGSTDDTGQVLERLNIPLTVIRNRTNRGKGYALRRGIATASGNLIAYIDADMSISPDYLLPMLERVEAGNDIVIASRFIEGGPTSDTSSRFRALSSRVFVMLRTTILGTQKCRDTQCGLKIFTSAVMESIISRCRIDGFGFDAEFLFLAGKANLSIGEYPVNVSITGKSKRYTYWLRQGLVIFRDLLRIRLNWWLENYDSKTG
jgi:dolichyl-phosphate beta-glucosyltransferase